MTDYTLATGPTPDTDPPPLDASLDPSAGGSINDKPIWSLGEIVENLNRTGANWHVDNYGELDDGVLNFGFWKNYDELANSYYVNATGTIAFNEAYYADDFSPFTEGQQQLAREAIALWDDLIAISFRETKSGNADIAYGNTYTGGAQAYAYLPTGSGDDQFYSDNYDFDEAGRLGGDVWIDGFVSSNFFPLDDSYYAKTTMIHETGHALGLSHPGDYNALGPDGEVLDPTYENQAEYAQDTLQYSIMSYFDAYNTGAQYIDWSLLNFAYPSTPMVHDIATIQAMYGADMTTRTGDTVYGFNSTADRAEFDFTQNTRPVLTIWDAGGNDTLDFSGWNTPSVIDLNPGAFSSGGGIEQFLMLDEVNANRAALGFAPRTEDTFQYYEDLKDQLGLTSPLFKDNIAIAYGATIENAIGGGGNDRIIGNSVANVLTGNAGADTFVFDNAGISGADRITDFGTTDVIAADKKISDSDGDGIINWSGNKALRLDTSDSDTLKLDGVSGNDGLRYLGTKDGEYYYGLASVKPDAGANEKVFESGVGDDVLKGSSKASVTDVFFFDTANALPGLGSDKLTFTANDLLVTTTQLADSNGDGRIHFDQLHLSGSGGTVALTSNGTQALHDLEYDGHTTVNGVDYYVYSLAGSSVGLAELHI